MTYLTPRELDVLRCAAHGMSIVETGRALYISPSTAKEHRKMIALKLDTRNVAAAVWRALELGLIDPPRRVS